MILRKPTGKQATVPCEQQYLYSFDRGGTWVDEPTYRKRVTEMTKVVDLYPCPIFEEN